jgi:ankyrin repeat protein
VKLLLKNGADPNLSNPLGVTALTVATRGGFDKIVELLFEEDAFITDGKFNSKNL